jgi:hypothetical protein
MKSINFRGKKYNYRTQGQLANKLGIPLNDVRELLKSQDILVKKGDKIRKVNLKENPLPLLKREFDIHRVANKKMTNTKKYETVKDVTFSKKGFGANTRVEVFIVLKMYVYWSEVIEIRDATFNITTYVDNIENMVREYADNWANETGSVVDHIEYKIYDRRGGKKLKLENYVLRDENFKLTEFKNIVYHDDKENCVVTLLRDNYLEKIIDNRIKHKHDGLRDIDEKEKEIREDKKEYKEGEFDSKIKNVEKERKEIIKNIKKDAKNELESLENDEGVTVEVLTKYCEKNIIPIMLYSITGELIYNSKKTETKAVLEKYNQKPLVAIAYNNHIYEVDGKKPIREVINNDKIKIIPNANEKIIELIEKKIIPGNVNFSCLADKSKITVVSFTANKRRYIANDEYAKCLEILTKFELQEYIYDSITIKNLGPIIEKNYLKSNINSFWPDEININKGGFLYKTEEDINDKKTKTIDKVKAYTYNLTELPYLIVCDWWTAKITKNPKEIIDHYLYIAKPKKSSILLPNTNIYAGSFLNQCKKYVDFEVLEQISTTTTENYYKTMIDDMKKHMSLNMIKDIINVLIGKGETKTRKGIEFVYKGILNKDEEKLNDDYAIELNDKYNISFDTREYVKNIYNRKPIAIQVKDACRLLMFEKMKQMKLKDEDIVQVKTDSITFYGDLPKDLDKDDITAWKQEEFKPLKNAPTVKENKELSFFIDSPNPEIQRDIHLCYAGAGKTTYVINKRIPKINKETSMVTTPSHSSMEEYKTTDINHAVIQKYTLSNTIIESKHTIIDEIGFIDRKGHELLYKLMLLGRSYEAYGDFNQLPPVKETERFDTPQYLQYMFNKQCNVLTENHRNAFTKKYYDSLILKQKNLPNEVKKYSTENPEDAEIIICYYNKTIEKYNEIMLEKLGKKWGQVGTRYICRSNGLLESHGIYNHKMVTIVKKFKDENDTMVYKLSDKSCVNKKQLEKHFSLGYAVTVYGIQGKTINSYYWAQEDNRVFCKRHGGRIAYTIISRLKQDKDEVAHNEWKEKNKNAMDQLKELEHMEKGHKKCFACQKYIHPKKSLEKDIMLCSKECIKEYDRMMW